jgi:hypothetical protein
MASQAIAEHLEVGLALRGITASLLTSKHAPGWIIRAATERPGRITPSVALSRGDRVAVLAIRKADGHGKRKPHGPAEFLLPAHR